MKKSTKVVLAAGIAFGLPAAGVGALAITAASMADQSTGAAPAAGPCVVPAVDTKPLPTGDAQVRNFKTIIARGKAKGVPQRGIEIALAVTLVESNALNLASRKVPESMRYPNDGVAPGDHLSINLFQQQVGMGWFDTVEHGMQVPVATDSFLGALLNVNGWQVMTFSGAAQAVQRSAFPSRYGQREAEAKAIYAKYASTAPAADVVPASASSGPSACPQDDTTVVTVSGAWANPLKPASYVLTSPFGMRMDPVLHIPKMHKGQDMGAAANTPVKSVCTGVVKAAGWDSWGGGNMTTLNCGGGITIKLMHQSKILVKAGDKVNAGQVIGIIGTTGNSTGIHLHEQVEQDGNPIDPIPFMRARGVPL